MWTKPWKMKEGFLIGGGLLALGLVLQAAVGPVHWDGLAFLTFGMLFGALWAQEKRGALFLLLLAFLCLQMCWWGINYLPSAREFSVHTY